MIITKRLHIIETHTAGNPTRHILSGVPSLEGATMADKMMYFKEHYDYIRKMVVMEPRGSEMMSGVVYTAPSDPSGDMGIFFFETGGYLNFCGHSLIAAAKVATATGYIDPDRSHKIIFDTPVGLIQAVIDDNDLISFETAPAYLWKSTDVAINGKTVPVDIAYGGVPILLVDSNACSIDISIDNLQVLSGLAKKIHTSVTDESPFISHLKKAKEAYHGVYFYQHLGKKINVAVFAVSENEGVPPVLDRSPCGAGTSAKLAADLMKGRIKENEILTFQSLTGGQFFGAARRKITDLEKEYVVSSLSGTAYLTAITDFIHEAGDDIGRGFSF